jgi:hypothetical protein
MHEQLALFEVCASPAVHAPIKRMTGYHSCLVKQVRTDMLHDWLS